MSAWTNKIPEKTENTEGGKMANQEDETLEAGTEITLDVTDTALPDGLGVARWKNMVIFVPDTVAGDRAIVRIVKTDKRFSYGELVRLDAPSPIRTVVSCPHFGPCGGCSLQHLHYEHQLSLKGRHVRQVLARIGGIDLSSLDMPPVIASPDTFNYRGKVELSFGEDQGKTVLGLRESVSPMKPYTGQVVPVRQCMVFGRAVEKLVPLFLDLVHGFRLLPYDVRSRKGFLRHLVVREAKSTGEIMVIIETTAGPLPDLAAFWNVLVREVPETQSMYHIVNDRPGDGIGPGTEFHLFGKPFIEERLDRFRFRIYPQSFFQPNPKAAQRLYLRIADLVSERRVRTVLGLYCGMGPIELFLSPYAEKVYGIDSLPQNIANARENSVLNNVTNCLFKRGVVEDLRKNPFPSPSALIVVDPPRTGLRKEAIRFLLRLGPPGICYVSCDPATLARDLKVLLSAGYGIDTIEPFDFFPHTGHVETFVMLSKS
jgi:23S rRNA (uracil1939-C5)-methyltransferase